MRAKLGVAEADDVTGALVDDLLTLLHEHALDYTSTFRALSASLRDGPVPAPLDAWAARWREQLGHEGADLGEVAAAMERVNPVYVPRNHQVEDALAAATAGDLGPFERLVDVVTRPFDERPGLDRFLRPEERAVAQDERLFDHVLELADVAGPRVLAQRRHRGRREAADGAL